LGTEVLIGSNGQAQNGVPPEA